MKSMLCNNKRRKTKEKGFPCGKRSVSKHNIKQGNSFINSTRKGKINHISDRTKYFFASLSFLLPFTLILRPIKYLAYDERPKWLLKIKTMTYSGWLSFDWSKSYILLHFSLGCLLKIASSFYLLSLHENCFKRVNQLSENEENKE